MNKLKGFEYDLSQSFIENLSTAFYLAEIETCTIKDCVLDMSMVSVGLLLVIYTCVNVPFVVFISGLMFFYTAFMAIVSQLVLEHRNKE